MLYTDLAKALLAGQSARRRSWAPGVIIRFLPRAREAEIHHLSDALVRTMLNLALLTPSGTYRYFTHSVDRRANDWEIYANGAPNYPSRG